MTLLVVGAVILRDGRAFIHRRSFDRALMPGCWDIPGGHVEEGESPLEALQRELEEETGWRLRRIVADLGEHTWTGNDGLRRHEFDYLIEVDGDLAAPRLEWPEQVEYAWVGPDELECLMESRAPDDTMLRELVARGLREASR